MTVELTPDEQLANDISGFYADPLGHVMYSYPWDTERSIQVVELPEAYRQRFRCEYGPDLWACEFLDDVGARVRERKFDGQKPVSPIKFSTVSGHEIGKDQPYSLVVDTPDGRKTWGDVEVGSRLFGRDGRPVTVLARHEQGVQPMYRVTLSDGTSTFCGRDHLWAVRGRQERRRGVSEYREMTVRELISAGVRRSNGRSDVRQWELPQSGVVEYETADLPVDPYVLGAWLGDGTRATAEITNADEEVWRSVEEAGYELSDGAPAGQARTRRVYGLQHHLREMELLHVPGDEVWVPLEYRQADAGQRLAVLQGLLDTDGWVEATGTVMFGSVSQDLAADVAWLARSLGLVAREKAAVEKWYRDEDGERVDGKPFYCTSISWDGRTPLFRIGRKLERLVPPRETRSQRRWIDRIDYSHDERSMCVTVDAEDGLYLTNDFIVTHNTTLVAWIIKWIMDTRPFCKGTVTAVTDDQLRTKTWAELGKWHFMSPTEHWFKYHATRGNMTMYSADERYAGIWRVDARTPREEKSESFQGQHAPNSTSFFIFDEASGISDKLFEVREGGLSSGEPMVFDFGNGTRNSGRFYENCVGRFRDQYVVRSIDSRTVAITNKEKIAEDVAAYGEDSDFVRTRWRGLFPAVGSCQFVSTAVVEEAGSRVLGASRGEPRVLGVDVARFGDDSTVVWPRKGTDARSFPPSVARGLDTDGVVNLVSKVYGDFRQLGDTPVAIFVDEGYNPGVVDRLRSLQFPVLGVKFGGGANDKVAYRFKVDEMWDKMRKALDGWLCVPGRDTEAGAQLFSDLTGREYGYTLSGQIRLEPKSDMKKRGLPSPDYADALALTFAEEVAARESRDSRPVQTVVDYDPFAEVVRNG